MTERTIWRVEGKGDNGGPASVFFFNRADAEAALVEAEALQAATAEASPTVSLPRLTIVGYSAHAGDAPTSDDRFLLLSVLVPADFMPDADPDDIADEMVRLLNEDRRRAAFVASMLNGSYDPETGETGAPKLGQLLVGALPWPQWLTTKTLHRLRAAAREAKS